MNRRGFLGGLAGIFAAGAAPAIIHDAMKIVVPKTIAWSDLPTTPQLFEPSPHLYSLGADYDGDVVWGHLHQTTSQELEALHRKILVRNMNQAVEDLVKSTNVLMDFARVHQPSLSEGWPKRTLVTSRQVVPGARNLGINFPQINRVRV